MRTQSDVTGTRGLTDWRDRLDVVERAILALQDGDESARRRSIRGSLEAVAADVADARRTLDGTRPGARSWRLRLPGSRRRDLADRLAWIDATDECELVERRVRDLGRLLEEHAPRALTTGIRSS